VIEIRKLILFIVVLILFIYMILINFGVFNKYGHKKLISAFMISGLGLISVGAFFDMISNLIDIKCETLISTCFTAGEIIFAVFIILWSNNMARVIYNLNKCANNDPMTGLYNRKGFENIFLRKINTKASFYIMVFDLDKTKLINDKYGHLEGDQYIIRAAKIIKTVIGKNGFVGRTGGDEFIALVENIKEEKIEEIKYSIKNRVSHIFSKQSTQISIGYSKYKRDGKTFENLLSFADKRMYEDKQNRRNAQYLMAMTNDK